jgi:beta-lactamase regulating signal transducer with metallopeptidase domain
MNILFITQLTGTDIVKAICWTLVHSLWQGLLLAIAGGLTVIITKKRHPSFRYNLLSTLFLLFVITSAYTFTEQLNHSDSRYLSSPATSTSETFNQADALYSSSSYHDQFKPLINSFTYYFDKHAPLVVITWFIILSARLVKMFSGLTYINRIRSRQIHEPMYYWKNRLRELQLILRISKPVQLLESDIIKVPMAMGWLKPLILVPAGLFIHLSSEQLEAILLHELAHIKRRDYLVNLLQSLAETIFFFNPPVIWISSLIREERENCCDDIAISITKSKSKFINALVSFGEYNNAAYAMPFSGRKNQLLNRVQRIIHNSNNTLNSIEKAGIVTCCLFIILLFAFIIPSHGKRPLFNQTPIIKGKFNNWAFIPLIKPEVVQPLQLGDQNDDFKKEEDIKVEKSAASNSSAILQSSEIKLAKISGYYKPVIEIEDTVPKLQQHIYKNNTNAYVNSNVKYTLTDSFKLNPVIKINTNIHLSELKVTISPLVNKQLKLSTDSRYLYNYDGSYNQQTYKTDSSILRQPYQSDSSYKRNPYKATPHSNPLADPVIIDLIKENIIKESVIINKENFYYILNNDELIVQGVKQNENVYRKMRVKYISPTGKTTRSYTWRN